MTFFSRVANEFYVLLTATLPILELRGAIPLAWRLGLTWQEAFFFSFIGNMLPILPLILLSRKAFTWLGTTRLLARPSAWLQRNIEGKQALVTRYSIPGLIVLVGIPLPGTGAWTGAMISSLLGLRIKHALPAIAAGVLIADVIVTVLTYGLLGAAGA